MSEGKAFLTGDSELASRIANSLGLEGISVNALSLHIEAGEVITADCRFFPTEEQLKSAAKEVAALEGGGIVMGKIELFYSSELDKDGEGDGEG